MCEYERQYNCRKCNDAIKEDGFVVGCLLEEKQQLEDEEIMRQHEEATEQTA